MFNYFPNRKYHSLHSSKQKHGQFYHNNTLVPLTNSCLNYCFIAVKRHKDQKNSNEGEYLIGSGIQFLGLTPGSNCGNYDNIQTDILAKTFYYGLLLVVLFKNSKLPHSWEYICCVLKGCYKGK